MSTGRRGSYGMAVTGLEAVDHLLVDVPDDAPQLDVRRRPFTPWDGREVDDDHLARFGLLGGGWLEVSRAARTATFYLPDPVEDDDFAHPLLAAAASSICRWDGRTILHGGVLARGGRAVAVVGDREAGKSSLMAWTALRRTEVDVLADDLVVLQDETVWAGPRCIDLRPGATASLDLPTTARLTRASTRTRLQVGQVPQRAALHNVVVLAWGAQVSLERLPVAARLPALLPHTAVLDRRAQAPNLLALASLTVWLLRRPRDWGLMDDCLAKVLGVLDG